ncbi:MAG: N-acetylmuramate alpha-1-phosphate uridylyltransferase MurU [Steroidobacteraceae bacterium]
MRAMLLAAGRGERLRPITDTVPKPLASIAGRALIEYHLENLLRAGIVEVVINLSWLGERIRAALGAGERYGLTIRYSEEGPVAFETGGGIARALPLLGAEPFLVVNADVWTDLEFASLGALPAGADASIVLAPNPEHHPGGDFTLRDGAVVEEGTDRLTYTGIGIYRPEFFAGCPQGRFPLRPLLRRAIAAGRLRGRVHRGEWFDAGTPERLAWLDAHVRGRRAD